MRRIAALFALPVLLAAAPAPLHPPSRPAPEGCVWEAFRDSALGLAAWVQRCDYGSRKIDFLSVKNALAVRFSDGGAPDAVVEVYDLQPGETPRAGVERVLRAHTDTKVAARCVVAPFTDVPAPVGVERFSFVPDAAYRGELAKADEDGIPDPPCGDWGETADSVQYWETQPTSGVRRIVFVRAGQDDPQFDETQLRLLPPD